MASDNKPVVGWIGLGMMGWPMARHMVEAGYDVRVFDLRSETSQRFAGEIGGEVAPTLEALGAASDIVVTMVPDGKAARMALIDGADNASKGMKKGAVAIDMSSSEPTGTVALGAALKEKGISLCDAPVSGGTWRAEEGSLAIMLGGADDAALDAAEAAIKPALEAEDFAAAMSAMAALRAPVDAFFEAVQVNTDNQTVRRNRLNLLSRIRTVCISVADLTRIES